MIDERKLPIKHCDTCGTHFRAPPEDHREVEGHDEDEFSYTKGDWRKAERMERFKVEGEIE